MVSDSSRTSCGDITKLLWNWSWCYSHRSTLRQVRKTTDSLHHRIRGLLYNMMNINSVSTYSVFTRYGRKPTAMATSLGLFVSMVITSGATNLFFFLTFSVLSGFCCGGSLAIAYTYWAEVSSLKHRYDYILSQVHYRNSNEIQMNGIIIC